MSVSQFLGPNATPGYLGRAAYQRALDAGLTDAQIASQAAAEGLQLAADVPIGRGPSNPPPTQVSAPTYEYATKLAEIAGTQQATSINANSLIEVERIRQAGESERAKMDIESRVPTIQAEAKGKMDLQAIVNAGYKNIANIERGSNMFSSIMSAFNF